MYKLFSFSDFLKIFPQNLAGNSFFFSLILRISYTLRLPEGFSPQTFLGIRISEKISFLERKGKNQEVGKNIM